MDGRFISIRRKLLGLSQRELAVRSGVKQPLISAIEAGRREVTESTSQMLASVLALRPSLALAKLRDEVLRIVGAHHGLTVHVFGSVARGEDGPESDADLIVVFDDQADIADLLVMEEELSAALTIPVDVISAGSSSSVIAQAKREMVAL